MHMYNGIYEYPKQESRVVYVSRGGRFCSAQIEILTVKSKETEYLNSALSHTFLAVVADMKPLFLHIEQL